MSEVRFGTEKHASHAIDFDTSTTLVTQLANGVTRVAAIGTAGLPEVHVQIYGAVGDGVTDDTVAIQAAMDDATGKRLIFRDGYTYLLTDPIIGVSGVAMDLGTARITATARVSDGYFRFQNMSNIHVRGGIFDGADDVLPTYVEGEYGTRYNVPLYFETCSDVTIEHGQFEKLYNHAIFAYQCTGVWRILHNRFRALTRTQQVIGEHILFASADAGSSLTVFDNDFENEEPTDATYGVCDVLIQNTYGKVNHWCNRHTYGGRSIGGNHQLGALAFYSDHTHASVLGNRFTNVMAIACRMSKIRDFEIAGNWIESAATATATDELISIQSSYVAGHLVQGCQRGKVHHNWLIEDYDDTRKGVGIYSYDYGTPATDIEVTDNNIIGCGVSVSILGAGKRLKVNRNIISGGPGGGIILMSADGPAGALTTVLGTQAASEVTNIDMRDNVWDTVAKDVQCILVSFNFGGGGYYTGTVGTIDVSGTRAKRASFSTASAIHVYGISGAVKGRVVADGVVIENFTNGIDLAHFPTGQAIGGFYKGCTVPIVNAAGMGALETRVNHYGTGPMSGVATMFNGSVIVYTDEFVPASDATYHVKLTRVQAAGTAFGALCVGTLSPGAWFEILSQKMDNSAKEGGDQSSVYWEIEH